MDLSSDSFVAERGSFEALLAALNEVYSTRVETAPVCRETVHDSFDWRLHRKGLRLACRRRGRGVIARLSGASGAHEETLDAEPAFAADLPAGALRDTVSKALSVRRLMPVIRVRRRPRTVLVLNEDGKTVVRVAADVVEVAPPEVRARWTPVDPRWVLRPLRGYDDEARAVGERLSGLPGARRDAEPELERWLAAIGLEAGAYSSKVRLSLDPDEPAGVAVRRVLADLLTTMRVNESGTIDDLDSEFLHDFRVSVRRTRSCLGQMKTTLPAGTIAPFRKEFAWLGSITGPTRDLDVFLIDLVDRHGCSGEVWSPLVDLVRRDQRREQKKMARQLQSKRYGTLVQGWSEFLERPPIAGEAPESERPIAAAAGDRIARKYAKMVARGRKLDAERATGALHRMRIEGKKLRYLLEFFRSVFPAERVDPPIAALKRLQDNLGAFNDLQVQQAALPKLAQRLERAGAAPTETYLGIGRLVERLARRERKVRREFQAQFDGFAGEEIATLMGVHP